MVTRVNIHEAKTHLSKLVERVEAGEAFTIARAGRPVASLGPLPQSAVKFGTGKGLVRYNSETFDDPDPEIIAIFEGDG